jgi:hypothetical protein
LHQTTGNNSPKEPANVIIDNKGLSIDLKWATNKNEPTALTDADLDLDVVNSREKYYPAIIKLNLST